MTRELPAAFGAAGIPAAVSQALAGHGGVQAVTGVGNAGAALLAALPPGVRELVVPYVPSIVAALHSAFSIATASTFTVGIATTVGASCLVLLFKEAPAKAREKAWSEVAEMADEEEPAVA